jgi:hypothetical protein
MQTTGYFKRFLVANVAVKKICLRNLLKYIIFYKVNFINSELSRIELSRLFALSNSCPSIFLVNATDKMTKIKRQFSFLTK